MNPYMIALAISFLPVFIPNTGGIASNDKTWTNRQGKAILSAVTCPAPMVVCENTPEFTITGASPSGGHYAGSGVSNNIFNPAANGPGVYNITYTYWNPCGCWYNTCTFAISVVALPEVEAGSDKDIMAGETVQLNDAAAEGSSGVLWTTSGDGNFDNPESENPVYRPGHEDIKNREVVLCIQADPIEPCEEGVNDCLTVSIDIGDYPQVQCPANIAANSDPGMCHATGIDPGEPIITDPYGIKSMINDLPSEFPVGQTIVVTWTVVNIYNGTAVCQQNVDVSDVEPPALVTGKQSPAAMPSSNEEQSSPYPAGELHLPGIIADNDPGMCGAVVNWEPPLFTDNCGEVEVAVNFPPGDFFPAGTTTVTYTATDKSGNQAAASFNVTVNDREPPYDPTDGPPLADITVENDPGMCGATVLWNAPEFIDNCGEVTVESNYNTGDIFPIGSFTVTYSATDTAGNQARLEFTVTVFDADAPDMQCPEPILVELDEAAPPDSVELIHITPQGGIYSGKGVTNNIFYPEQAGAGVHLITYTYTNPSSTCVYNCMFEIQVVITTTAKQLHQEQIRIYPNPGKNIFNIEGVEGEAAKIVILDNTGRVVQQLQTHLPATIDLFNHPRGIYFIRLHTRSGLYDEKIVQL